MDTMTWNEVVMVIINTVFKLIITVGIPALFALASRVIKGKQQEKYLGMVKEMVVDAVQQTQQVYVDNMKAEDVFDEAAQRAALNTAKTAVLNALNERAKKIVVEAVGDFESYLETLIESTIYENKKFLTPPQPARAQM